MNEQTIECGNPPCNCTILAQIETEAYCSPACAGAAEAEEAKVCICSHPPCDAD